MFLELKFICNEVFWSANEFGDDFGIDDFLDKLNVVFQTHVHAFSTTTLTGFVFCMMRFIFGSCQLYIFVNSLDVFGICANSAFEEKMEVKLIYFWKDGEFITNEFTNMLMMFVYRRRCMLQRQSS